MITDSGANFDLRNNKGIFEIDFSHANISEPYKVLSKDIQGCWAVVVLKWNWMQSFEKNSSKIWHPIQGVR